MGGWEGGVGGKGGGERGWGGRGVGGGGRRMARGSSSFKPFLGKVAALVGPRAS